MPEIAVSPFNTTIRCADVKVASFERKNSKLFKNFQVPFPDPFPRYFTTSHHVASHEKNLQCSPKDFGQLKCNDFQNPFEIWKKANFFKELWPS